MLKIVTRSTLFIVAIFCLISIIAFSSLKISYLSFIGNDDSRTKSFLYIMSLENHSLQTVLPHTPKRSFGKDAFALLTNINLNDMKTFLISEIPGLYAASPKILIAGDGTDFTNLPIESPPPKDFGKESESEKPAEEPKEEIKQETKNQTKDYVAYIYHTHTRESYIPLLEGNQSSSKDKNVTLLGKRLGEKLGEKGIKTLVDTTDVEALLLQRNMKYYQSYAVSRELVTEAINQNKNVELVFDIHRDSQRKKVTTATIKDQKYAKTIFVIGEGNPHYAKNLEFAGKLHKNLQEKYPGLSRGVMAKPKIDGNNGVYNQDLAEKGLLIEIGGVDNNLEELNRTVDALAEVISDYYWEDSVEASKNK
ncbi:stage II sporulation protein P [Lederbergia lenta]|uniref:Stage II sporulation protein P n=1 Tax=Lederbergia lenta TaxID=1467 RepID=A0A2X4WIG7_LEDLE|nr:stage II sporulation protein P [Lederbergia lenta]MCM3109741.1 stage II sporulation protein P [Lederbergia lenta]MEC2324508.1 stage II sporulation protein P [Lederbergia lenta]SQI59678.1 stage II sporulation protein P [Lederbergia lenta]